MSTLSDDEALQIRQRQHWMHVIARSPDALASFDADLRHCSHRFIRPAEIGMAMVRARAGASGSPFNVGEMTMTRCAVQLADGTVGHGYVAGRNRRHAELAALADARLQGGEQAVWMHKLIDPAADALARAGARNEARNETTRVDVTTLVRGED
jgi:alpha-D-ribose 1-methylphosphonate 5-triphosphate synthase subunit PhnG